MEHEEVGVIVLGREMKKLVSTNKDLVKRITKILEEAIGQENPVLSLMIQDSENETIEDKKNILEKLKLGFTQDAGS